MIIGIPKEIKNNENQIGIIPAGVNALVREGHQVIVERNGGIGSGIVDQEYISAGAEVMAEAEEIWQRAEMIIKVKEPQPEEFEYIRPDQTLFTSFHFAADRRLAEAMINTGAVCVACETIERDDGSLPLLTPMSEVAGRMAVQEGAKYLEKPMAGRGILLGGVPGVEPASVLIIGAGIVGASAARLAALLGARVTLLDIDLGRLRDLAPTLPANVVTLYSNAFTINEKARSCDLLVGAVHSPGARTPVLVPESLVGQMRPGSVIVDVAIDQGGCVETSRPTTHTDPTFVSSDVVHYCVPNMPGAVGRTSTYALSNATMPFAVEIANKGFKRAAMENKEIARGINVLHGKVTHEGVAAAFNMEYTSIYELLT